MKQKLVRFRFPSWLGDSVTNALTCLSSLISLRLPSKYNLRNSSDKLFLSNPRFKLKATLGDRSFTYAAPKLWNALPFDIRSAITVSIFKAKLKLTFSVIHFYHSCFYYCKFTFNCNLGFLKSLLVYF